MSADRFDAEKSATVHVLPAGLDIVVLPSEVLMRAAQVIGIRWPNVCNGQAQCGMCAVEVMNGDMSSFPPSTREQQMLDRLAQRPRFGGIMRLACQLTPNQSLTVQKMGVRPPVKSI